MNRSMIQRPSSYFCASATAIHELMVGSYRVVADTHFAGAAVALGFVELAALELAVLELAALGSAAP